LSIEKMKMTKVFNALISGILYFCSTATSVALASPNFNQAVADYNAGKYGQAAAQFEALKAAYPTNALTRYYLALCRQGLGHFDKAREEYQFVATNGDARLRAMAMQGMQKMTGARTSVASTAPSMGTASASNPSQSLRNPNTAMVKKIYRFTAPWCAVCVRFAPVYEAVKPKFNDIQFEDVDYDSNQDLKAQYNVTSVPRLVFLDSAGKVLFNGNTPRTPEGFTHLIQKYH